MSARYPIGVAGLLCLTLGACRDAPGPFVPPEREPQTGPAWQLTHNPGDDRAPAWSPDGEHIVYTAVVDTQPGLLLTIPYRGGIAERTLADVQADTGTVRRFTMPAVSPSGDVLAFAHFIMSFGADLCGETDFLECEDFTHPQLPKPRLATVWLRLRRFDATGSPDDDPRHVIDFEGRYFDEAWDTLGLNGVWIIDHYPFHQVYLENDRHIFRPSWSPDGTRLAFSDGLRILIWDIGTGTATAVPGTDDGVSPAWSPDGEWIAFTRLERLGSTNSFCQHIADGNLSCVEQNTVYTLGRRILTLIRPDGSGPTELGNGEEPAWTPDGSEMYFTRDDQIWRLVLAGGDPIPVAQTAGGREPAVSPTGDHLAFARLGADSYSIWVISLPD